jgi:hypothetical protein
LSHPRVIMRIASSLIPHGRALLRAAVLGGVIGWCAGVGASAQQNPRAAPAADTEIESKVKAAYLYKFGSYVDWPEQAFAGGPSAPLLIGVIDAGPLADELAGMVVGRSINGRPLQIRKLQPGDPLTGLNVLFVGRSHNGRLADILAAARAQPILTVTEADNALSVGGIINFVPVDGRLRFEVAPRTASLCHLVISARLLAAAYKVENNGSAP